MNEVKISQLNKAKMINSDDLMILNQNGATKAVSVGTILETILKDSKTYVTENGETISSIKERLLEIEEALRSAGML